MFSCFVIYIFNNLYRLQTIVSIRHDLLMSLQGPDDIINNQVMVGHRTFIIPVLVSRTTLGQSLNVKSIRRLVFNGVQILTSDLDGTVFSKNSNAAFHVFLKSRSRIMQHSGCARIFQSKGYNPGILKLNQSTMTDIGQLSMQYVDIP